MGLVHKAIPISGSGGVINLGTGNTFDLTGISGYQNFTVDNFLVVQSETVSKLGSYFYTDGNEVIGMRVNTPTKSYDQVTGILSVSQTYSAYVQNGASQVGHVSGNVTNTVYLVTGDIKTL